MFILQTLSWSRSKEGTVREFKSGGERDRQSVKRARKGGMRLGRG